MTTPIHEKILLEGLKEGNEKIFDYIFHYYYSGLVVFVHSDEEGMKCDTLTSDKGEVTHVITITGLPTANC